MISSVTALHQQQSFQQPQSQGTPSDTEANVNSTAAQAKITEISDTVKLSKTAKDLKADEKKTGGADEKNLSEDQQRQVDKLKKRDTEVKAHERAHMAAGGGLVQGGASYTYQRGTDGKLYAVGGEVKIDTSAERDPDQTVRKMEQVKRAALAPAQPSGTDRAVAARASQIQLQAQMEKTQQSEGGNEEVAAISDRKSEDDSVQAIPDQKTEDNSSQSFSDKGSADNSARFNPYARIANDADQLGRQLNISA